MPTGILIASVANAYDGQHLLVTLDGTPSGTPTFDCASLPDRTRAHYLPVPAAATFVSGSTWSVSVPYPDLWYVWVSDNDGLAATPGAGWAGLTDVPDLDATGAYLQSVLDDNSAGLNAALQTLLPNVTLKQVVYGSATAIDDYPSILICKPQRTDAPIAMPYVFQTTYRLEVMCFVRHGDKNSVLSLGARFAARVMDILKRPCYNDFLLPSGSQINNAFCRTGESDETQDDETSFVSIGSLVWTGQALLQTPI